MSEESFYRPDTELAREPRQLPAEIYNLARLMVQHSRSGCVFVPIRSMQYLAVLDAEEIIFVDREGARAIEISWQRFRPQQRTSLDEPVPYEAVYYHDQARQTMQRLHGEFARALKDMANKQPVPQNGAEIITLPPARRPRQ